VGNGGSILSSRNLKLCVACGEAGTDLHHVKTRGSGGPDEDWNLVRLCRNCHTELHHRGQVRLFKNNLRFESALREKGWELDERGKLWNERLRK